MPRRIQRQRVKGWRMPSGAICVDRRTVFGNPFPVDCYGREGAVDRFRRWATGCGMSTREMSESSRRDRWSSPESVSLVTVRAWMLTDLPKLRGMDLVCWCSLDGPCHADVLIELAND